MAILVGVILGSEGSCCPCSTTPPCSDCKTKEPPPPPPPPCDCADKGLFNATNCGGACDSDCCTECLSAGPCDPETITSQGCYDCLPSPAPCTNCGYQASDSCGTGRHAVQVGACGKTCYKCEDDTDECKCSVCGNVSDCAACGNCECEPDTCTCPDGTLISCKHCFIFPCSEYGYQDNPSGCPEGEELVQRDINADCGTRTCWECVPAESECDESCFCYGCPGGCNDCPATNPPCCDPPCIACGDCGSCAVACGCTSREILSLKESIPDCEEAEFIKYDTLEKEVLEISDNPDFVASALSAAAYMGMYNRTRNTFHFSPNGARRYLQVLLKILKVDVAHHASYIEVAVEEGRNEIRIRGRNKKNEL